ncbi:MAG: hypothetical protein EXR72_12230 [Myxococcales bacterium]|nr:hypothetical protein [Myxococcales bacterium]
MSEESVRIELLPELWELAGRWINDRVLPAPTARLVYGAAATLLHVAASSWKLYQPATGTEELFRFDEDTFAELARDMFRKAKGAPAKPGASESRPEGDEGGPPTAA